VPLLISRTLNTKKRELHHLEKRSWELPKLIHFVQATQGTGGVVMKIRTARNTGTLVAMVILALLLGACVPISPDSGTSTVPAAQTSETFTDPFAYCAAVGTVDAPDTRWAGDEQPAVIADALRGPLGTMTDTPTETIQRTMVWRCANGEVMACVVGANLPCSEKADLNTEASEAVTDFCKENPDNDFVPMVVTGRATAYSWSCADGEPVLGEQMMDIDDQGFFADLWYQVEQP
jgi:hypothetical protein